jgi:hypothetical protein
MIVYVNPVDTTVDKKMAKIKIQMYGLKRDLKLSLHTLATSLYLNEIDINSFPRFRIYSTECPQGWYRYKDSCYKEFTGKKTWFQALDFCRNIDSDRGPVQNRCRLLI